MAKAQDFNTMMKDMMNAFPKDMMGAFPVDTKAMEDAFKTTATMNEKLSHVALEAAEKSTEISAKWTKDTLNRMSDISKAKADPADDKSVGAPMPGTVIEIRAEVGASIQAGEPLVVLSAMKMETVVGAPVGGNVKRIAVAEGDVIAPGDLIAELA